MTKRALTAALAERGFTPEHERSRTKARGWLGLLMRTDADNADT